MHESALRLVYDDSPYLNFDELPLKSNQGIFTKEISNSWQLKFLR